MEFGEQEDCGLQTISRWLAPPSPVAAAHLLDNFQDCCRFLVAYLHAGFRRREFAQDSVRCWPVTKFENYLVLNHVQAEHIEVWRVVQGAKDFEKPRLE